MIAIVLSLLLAQASPMPSESASASPSPTPSQAPLVSAPAGWKKLTITQPPGGSASSAVTEGWYRITKLDYSSLMFASSPNMGVSQPDFVKLNEQAIIKHDPARHLIADEPVSLCGGHSGEELVIREATQAGIDAKIRMLFVVLPSRGYVVAYRHYWDQPDDKAAIAALRAICPQWETTAANTLGPPPITPPANWITANMSTYMSADQQRPNTWAWVGPPDAQGHTGVVMAMTMPGSQSIDTSTLSAGLIKGMSTWATDVQMMSEKSVPLCAATGNLFEFLAIYKTTPVLIEAVVAPSYPTTYVSLYMRYSGALEDATAAAAIRSLCPRDAQSSG